MDYREENKSFDPDSQDYSAYESAELECMFENAETDSEAYSAIMAELSRRGYNFAEEGPEIIEEVPALAIPTLRYSIGGTRIWNLAALLLGVLGAAFFLKVQAGFGEIEQSLRIMVYAMVALLVTLSYLISGIRLLANHKDPKNPQRAVPTFEYWFLALLWFAFAAYEIYVGTSSFLMYSKLQLGTQIALFASLPSIMMMLFSFLLGMAMLYLALELRMPKDKAENVPF
jgi:hypothetical protein